MSSPHIRILVNAPIIEKVVGELLFHPDDFDNVTCERALNLFNKLEEPSGSYEVGQRDVYEVVIKTRRRFEICIKFFSCGALFRMAYRLMDCTQVESGTSVYGGCRDVVASYYTRVVCADALQILSDVLKEVWIFFCGRWVDSSRHIIYGCPCAFSLERGASQLPFDGNSAVQATHTVSRCYLFVLVEKEACCCVDGWCTEHDWKSSRYRHSYSILMPAGNALDLVWDAPARSRYAERLQVILGR